MSNEHSRLPLHRLWQPTTAKWFFVVFGFSLAYAVIRYHLAGHVEWRHFPFFILNKATSLAAVFFVASSYLIGKIIRWHDHDPALRLVVIKFCGLMGFFLTTFASATILWALNQLLTVEVAVAVKRVIIVSVAGSFGGTIVDSMSRDDESQNRALKAELPKAGRLV